MSLPRKIYLLTVLLPLLLPVKLIGKAPQSSQEQLKATFLFNFTQFVEWPADAYMHPGAPFLIGLYGLQSFEKLLDETVRGGRVAGHPIRILPVSKLADISQCQMLFISKSQVGSFFQIQPRLRGLNILTVSDAANFCKWGGVIAFISDSSRIRLQINLEAAAESGLRVSSKLLRLAEIVSPKS